MSLSYLDVTESYLFECFTTGTNQTKDGSLFDVVSLHLGLVSYHQSDSSPPFLVLMSYRHLNPIKRKCIPY